MAKIRRDYFSFIFQDDYLMPYYSCEENVLIARLIQEKIGRSEKDALLAGPIGKMGLSGNGIMKRFPYQLAGGQKQRLSFIRAILKDFDVLFGDEPTGNLDYQNSEHLFEFIKSKLQNKANSAIIVSHNIELSVAMADTIIVLTRAAEGSEFNFELKQENVFDRTSGKEYAGYKDPDDLIRFIKEIMSA
jgi:ABC-type lipoprotein export system ATPase subunit